MPAVKDLSFLWSGSAVRLAARLWRDYLSRYRMRLFFSFLAMASYAASSALIPVAVEWINAGFVPDHGRFAPSVHDVMILGPLMILLAGTVNAVSMYVQTRLNAGVVLSVLRDLQKDMFDRLVSLDLARQRQETSGHTASRFMNDTMVLRESLMRVSRALRDLLTLVALCCVMIWYDPVLFCVVLLVYPVIGLPVVRIGRRLRRISAHAQQQAGDVTAFVTESIRGARMVKTYQLENAERDRAFRVFSRRFAFLERTAFTRALNEPLIFLAGSFAVAFVVFAASWRIASGSLSGEAFTAFVISLLMFSQPARGLGTLYAVMQEGFSAFERMLSLVDARPGITDAPYARELSPGPGRISMENVCFSYSSGEEVLKDISLDIPAGKKTALVGGSGAGKSTLLDLLPRLYEPAGGRILLDGQDISSVTIRSLRASMALVSQDAVLFNLSALENIALGKPGSSRAEIMEAAKSADADGFIRAMPDGYDTLLGEAGTRLSGGQRQRIALARAFLKNAPVVLLDEPTSALDAGSEKRIHAALKRLCTGRTTVVVAHRLSTVADADLIVFMNAGGIVETGTHSGLMRREGAYAQQVRLQLQVPDP